jgi:hypothetical protein
MFSHYEPCEKCRERGKDSRGDNLAVYSDGGKHCFSCGNHIHPRSSDRWVKKVDHEIENKVKRILPDDFTWDVPARCWEWLLQYGLPYDHWKPIVGWSERFQRMVFRVGEPLSFSIGRYLPITPDLDGRGHVLRKWYVWGDAHKHVECLGNILNKSITLVEDLISAHKVSLVSECIPLFGTNISKPLLYYLRQSGKPINLWLDSDQGDNMPSKAANLSLLTGCQVNIINSNKDPKEYGFSEIEDYLSKCN